MLKARPELVSKQNRRQIAAHASARAHPAAIPTHHRPPLAEIVLLTNPVDALDKRTMSRRRPLYPRKRTCAVQLGMSALCQ